MGAKKTTLTFIGFLVLTSISFAQKDSVRTSGQWQFLLVSDYSAAYMKDFSSSSLIRYKVDLGFSASTGSGERESFFSPNSISNSTADVDENSNSEYLNCTLQLLWPIEVRSGVKLYGGFGPLISFSRDYSENEETSKNNNSPSNSITSRESLFFGIGIQLALIMEFKIYSSLSMIAEYDINGTYNWNKTTSKNSSQDLSASESRFEQSSYSWSTNLNRLKLGIGIRF